MLDNALLVVPNMLSTPELAVQTSQKTAIIATQNGETTLISASGRKIAYSAAHSVRRRPLGRDTPRDRGLRTK